MALSRGPKIVTNGLVLALDAADKNSYPGTGTTWNDLSGNNNTGVLTNGPTFNNANGGSIVFDGVDDSVIVTNSTSLKNNTITIDCVFKVTALSGDIIQFGVGSGAYAQYYFRSYSGTTYWDWFPTGSSFYGEAAVANSAYLPAGVWKNVILTGAADGSVQMYINGVSVGGPVKSATSSVSTWTPANLTIGGYSWDGYTSTQFAYTRIYNRVLTTTEVLQNYNATKSRFGL